MDSQSINTRPRTQVLVVALLIFLFGGYTLKRVIDKYDPVELLPQQQKVSGYEQVDIEIGPYKTSVYHPASYRFDIINNRIRRPRMIYVHGDQFFIGSQKGKVYRLDPPYNDATEIAEFDYYPHSIVVRENEILVAQSDGVYRADYSDDVNWIDKDDFELLVSLPISRSHSTRTLKLSPDNKLYLSMGWPGNCSDYFVHKSYPKEKRRGGIFYIDETRSKPRLVPFASGLRNPVDFDWHPETHVMYASNNGPDHLGFDLPVEYFSKITPGSFHGMPWYQFDGKNLFRDECAKSKPPKPIEKVSIPVATFPAHNAPLGVAFVTANANAKEYYGDAIVALHGSWVTESGDAVGDPASLRHPKLVLVKFENGEATDVVDLLSGFQLPSGERWARPAGVAIGPDGDIYFTSDTDLQGLYRLKKRDKEE